jgi:hypothetical protein
MGNSASQNGDNTNEDDDDDDALLDPFDGIDTLGYRVLGVQPNSPAARAGLVSFLDFLVGCNDAMLLGSGADLQPGQEYDDIDLPALLESNKGTELQFCTSVVAAMILVLLRYARRTHAHGPTERLSKRPNKRRCDAIISCPVLRRAFSRVCFCQSATTLSNVI